MATSSEKKFKVIPKSQAAYTIDGAKKKYIDKTVGEDELLHQHDYADWGTFQNTLSKNKRLKLMNGLYEYLKVLKNIRDYFSGNKIPFINKFIHLIAPFKLNPFAIVKLEKSDLDAIDNFIAQMEEIKKIESMGK